MSPPPRPTLWDVIGLGENSVDVVYRVPWYPQPDAPERSKVPIQSASIRSGGQVATTLSTCASLGLRTAYIGAFGNDAHGTTIRDEMLRRGIGLEHAVVRSAPNRYAVIVIDARSGERVVLWQRDARLQLDPATLPVDAIRATRLLHVDNTDPGASIAAARIARDANVPVTCDIDDVSGRTEELLALVTHPIFGEHAAAALTGEKDPESALRKLQQGKTMLGVTLGSRGAMLLAGGEVHHAPAAPIEVVDSTGAGDVFRGAFIHALLRGDAPREILRFANAAAAVSCTKEGAIGGVPTIDEIV